MMDKPEKTMADLLPEIAAAKVAHEDASRQAMRSRSVETESFNRLNDLYKRYQAAEKALRDSMPRSTDWHPIKRREGVSA